MQHTSTEQFRKAVPADLQEHFGKWEIKQSLRKYSPEERLMRLAELHKHWDEQFQAARLGGVAKAYKPITLSAGLETKTSNHQTPILSAAFESWSKTKPHTTESTRAEWQRAVRYFIELYGDLPLGLITKPQLADYRDALLKLPCKPSKNWQRMSLPQKLASIEAGEMADKEVISPKSVNKYLTAISALFEKAMKEGLVTSNPAQGLKLDAKHSRDDRYPFEEAELKAIFSQPVFEQKRQDDECYWTMLLGLYTGARLEEIGQLHLKDIRQQGEIWFLDINSREDDKSLKTASSTRKVPLHHDLIALGLLDYIAAKSAEGAARLFPRLQKDKRNKYTTALSKRLNRMIDAAGIQDRRKTFHSLRHTFRDYAALYDVPEDRIEALMGHASSKTSRAYGSGASLIKLNESLQQIRFPICGATNTSTSTSKLKSLPKRLEEYYAHVTRLQLCEVSEELASALHLPNGVMLAMLQSWSARHRIGEDTLLECHPTAFITREEVMLALRDWERMA